MEAQALRTKGWSISAIATHLGHDRKTIRAYLNGERRPGERKPARPESVIDYLDYCRQRLADDPHLWLTRLFDELTVLGFAGSYQALSAAVRRHELRPRCEACSVARSKDRSMIEHPAGQETQWDWLELPTRRCGGVWRTVGDDVTVAGAQMSLDRICVKFDARKRTRDGVRTTVGELADAEPLRAMPAPFPAIIEVERTVSNQAQIGFRGNRYSLLPGHSGEAVTVRHKLGSTTLDIVDRHGVLLAHHVRQPDGAGAVIRLDEHVAALTKVVLANFTDREPCRRKTRRPPTAAALAEAARIRNGRTGLGDGEHVVIDFADYVDQTRPFGGHNDQAGQR